MSPITKVDRLYVRTDWGLVRLIYFPALVVTAFAISLIPALATLKIKFTIGFGICAELRHWGHRAEEWFNVKPLLEITDAGLAYEDGGQRIFYSFAEIDGIAIQRRVAVWLTNGHAMIVPPFWLTLRIKNPAFGQTRRIFLWVSFVEPEFVFIDVWPREVVGGLLRLHRFAKALGQRAAIAGNNPYTDVSRV